jgi:hypothetical protein
MKTLRQADLVRVALAKGASVEVDGKTINASGERVSMPAVRPIRPVEQPAAPAPAPVPATVDTSGLERAATATQHSVEQLVQIVAMLVQQMRAGQQGAAPRTGFNFEVQRDSAGRLTNIKARPLAQGE